jgi:DNA-binding response OmpR family regulator
MMPEVVGMAKILIVDDDPFIRELVRKNLQNGGFEAVEASNGREALEKVEGCDLAVVDIMMPKMDGFQLCERIRKYYENLPLLFLTAKSGLPDKVKGFNLGADDYLTKPFEAEELVLRVKALLRRYKIESSQVITVGKLKIDRNGMSVDGEVIPMKEFELLFKLAGFPGRSFSRDQLIEDIWGYDFEGNERTLDVHIGRLRDRFPEEKYGFKITTLRGLGYKLEVKS